jgi:predicted metal-dependent phosphoesterase TrpH
MIDLELHSHTHYSRDSLNKLADVVTACRKAGIDRIAITDHSQIEGALKAHTLAPNLIIVGEEVKTTQGDLLCLFIHNLIPKGVTPEEAIARTHDQGGIVGAPHPLDPMRAGLGRDNVLRLREQIDFIEVFNARTHNAAHNAEADALARELNLPRACGSDAHLLSEIGTCRVRMREYAPTSPQDFLAALREATLITHTSSPLVHLASSLARTAHQLGFDKEHND